MRKNIKFVDLFAGIGGMRIPYDELGGECVFSSEIDKFARSTYEANFKEKPSGDITQIHEKDIPEHDILLAGFPCQAFSQAGLRRGFEDTRGTLFFHIARILKYHKPKAFLLENVKGLKNHNNGETLKIITRVLKNLENHDSGFGYNNLYTEILNAKNFGLPQNRERIFIAGFKNEEIEFKWPEVKKTTTRLGKILHKNTSTKYTISNKLWKSHKKRKKQARSKGYGFGYSLFNRDSVCTRTISARYYKDGSEILIEQKGRNPRMLTPREAARLQGFPEWFKIPVSRGRAYQQFGNAVPVNVIRHIARSMLDSISRT